MQIYLETDANHRALRRCYSCGAYTRPFDVDGESGVIRCRPCAEKRRRRGPEGDEDDRDPTLVNFTL